jgi:hypothetical protein
LGLFLLSLKSILICSTVFTLRWSNATTGIVAEMQCILLHPKCQRIMTSNYDSRINTQEMQNPFLLSFPKAEVNSNYGAIFSTLCLISHYLDKLEKKTVRCIFY